MPQGRNVEWTANALGGNLLRLAPMIAQEGGDMAIGIGDYPYPELGAPPNEVLVRKTVRIVRAAGGDGKSGDVRKCFPSEERVAVCLAKKTV